jgi:quercetin dioxygenase-like cupin family protein
MTTINLDNIEEKELFPGLHVKFVHTDNMTVAYWRIEAGKAIPTHSHHHEQVVNVIEGEFELILKDELIHLAPGKVVLIEPNAPHSGKAITECRIIDVFHPARQDYKF